jgi:protein arginine N-methyltransferase 3
MLPVFAARAGAKHVYAIEASGLAHKARKNIANNGLQHRITVVQGKVEEIELPLGKEVDVIVSEWMVSPGSRALGLARKSRVCP